MCICMLKNQIPTADFLFVVATQMCLHMSLHKQTLCITLQILLIENVSWSIVGSEDVGENETSDSMVERQVWK